MVELEVFDYDMDKAALIGPAPYAAQFAADMRTTHSNFGLLVDLSHFPTTYESTRFVIQVLRPYITHLHLGNAVVEEGAKGYGIFTAFWISQKCKRYRRIVGIFPSFEGRRFL